MRLRSQIRQLFNRFGYDISRLRPTVEPSLASYGFDRDFEPIYERCRPYTMTSPERMHALFRAIRYVEANGVEGDIVECGVAAGGSMMVAALTLMSLQGSERGLYLYDTFAGMTEPGEVDVDFAGNFVGNRSWRQWKESQKKCHNTWCYAALPTVKANMVSTGYPQELLRYVVGPVEKTIPSLVPERIALLRLDTDWYESTRHELTHLYPRLSAGGVLIVDDYGYWEGCRKAVDEYFAKSPPLLNRIDRMGVMAVKS
jgi:O-methyltransferase